MRRSFVFVLLLIAAAMLMPASASASTPTLKSLAKSLVALQKQVKTLQATVTAQKGTIADLKSTVTSQAGTISSLQSVVGATASDGLRKSVADIVANPVLTLSWLPDYLSLDNNTENGLAGPNLTLAGCNLHVRSTTSEDDTSGLGNLIVGWDNESPDVTFRTGSNNLVCGDQNNFNSYGGFMAGCDNATQDPCCSVSGGYGGNTVGQYASVSGGYGNMAGNGAYTSVTGGQSNCAFGPCSTVSGGEDVFGDPPTGILLRTADGWSAGGSFHNP